MLRRAWRRLRATPVFTVFAVASLALGVGVTTAIYAVVSSLTDTGLAVPNADRIGLVVGSDPLDARRLVWRSVMSRADLEDLRNAGESFSRAAVSARFYQSAVAPSFSEVVFGEAVSGNYFTLLGLVPSRGRLIQPSDDQSPSRVVVLGHQFWRTRFGANPDVVGQLVRLGGQPFEIVGIAPEGFGGLTDRIQSFTTMWVPLGSTSMFPSNASPPEDAGDRRRRQLTVLVPASSPDALETLSQQAKAIAERLDAAFPIDMRPDPGAAPMRVARSWTVQSVEDANAQVDRTLTRTEMVVMALVALVLVVACTNLANLVLARASNRQHEIAVRSALGAPRLRLVGEELAETGLLAVLGGLGAFVVGRGLILWFSSASLPISEAMVVQLDPKVSISTILVAAGSVLGSLVVFGVTPAFQITRGALRASLATDGGASGHFRWRARRRLISLQVAISLSFILIAAFAARIALGERSRSSGIDVHRLAVGMLNFRLAPWDETRARAAIDRLLSLAPAHPDLESISVSSGAPFGTNYTPVAELTRPDAPFADGREGYSHAMFLAATSTVFRTLGVPLVSGRSFDVRDGPEAARVAVLSEMAARNAFGTTDVVGRELLLRSGFNMSDRGTVRTLTIIGVAGDTDTQHRYSRDIGTVYVPLAQHYEPVLAVIGRATGDPAAILSTLKAIARSADQDLVVDRPATAAMAFTGAYVLVDIVSRVAGGLAVLVLVLAMAGLFGVLAHLVARRTREMGVRMALGADPPRIRRHVISDGLRPVLFGVGVGWAVGLLVRLLLRAAYNSPWSMNDLVLFGLAPLPILVAALMACYWPARRASRVDPNVALREL